MEKTKEQKFVETVDDMTLRIACHLDTLLTDEECDYHIEVTKENLTEFFTALSNAIGHKLIRTSGMAETLLEAQHVYNSLLVQYLLKNANQRKEK
ncbi:MAG: hypothetical protein II825_09410 [Paludibacteraceae bacterium]|nr:hypothetical protein [Paludibacteraceae bacterium]